jgi:hypothetical protein
MSSHVCVVLARYTGTCDLKTILALSSRLQCPLQRGLLAVGAGMEVLQRLLKALGRTCVKRLYDFCTPCSQLVLYSHSGSKAVQAEEARPTVTADLLSQQAPSKEEQEFLDIAGDAYGYLDASKKRRIDGIRQREFSRLEAPRPGAEGIAYLDWGGAALFSEQQLEAAHDELRSTLLCNPHR